MSSWLRFALGALAMLTCAPSLAAQGKRPNVLFIFTDDHAPHAIGAMGGPLASVNPTPNIDRLASEGMLFRKSFCTNSICGPSRAVILTGKHSHKNGFRQNGERFDPTQATFPKYLQGVGYETAIIGKWHLGSDPQGFDYWDVLPGQGDYYNPILRTAKGNRTVEGYCTDIVTGLAIDWLKERDDERPFFLMCQHKAPHRNWMPPLRHLSLYADVEIPEPATLFDRWADNATPASIQEMEIDRHMDLVYDLFLEPFEGWDKEADSDKSGFQNLKRMTPAQRETWRAAFAAENAAFLADRPTGEELVRWKYQRYLKNYLRTIRGVDDSVGALLAYLEDSGLADDTIVVYSSDQGFYLGDHGWYDKRWMYEESLGMPLIVRWPGETRPGSVNEHLVQNIDYAPTFLDLAGLSIPADMQGRSLVPLLKGESPAWRDAIYYHYYGFSGAHHVARHYGIRTDRHKLIHFYDFDEWELYDLEADPDESTNLFGQPEQLELTARLAVDLGELRGRFEDDSIVVPKPEPWRAQQRARSAK